MTSESTVSEKAPRSYRGVAIFGYFWFSFMALRLAYRWIFLKQHDIPTGLDFLTTSSVSIQFWGFVWLAAALSGFIACARRLRGKWFILSIVLMISIHMLWSLAYFAGWLDTHSETLWSASATYAAPVGLLLGWSFAVWGGDFPDSGRTLKSIFSKDKRA